MKWSIRKNLCSDCLFSPPHPKQKNTYTRVIDVANTSSLIAKLKSRHSEPTPRPQTRTLIIQHEHAENAHHAQRSQQTDALVDAQVDEERPREQDAPARQGRAEEIVAREQRGGVLRVGKRDVDEDALKDHEAGTAVDDDADHARDPGEVGPRGPGEDEEAYGGQEGADECGDEAVFLGAEPVREDVGDEVVVEVGDVGEDAEAAGDEDAGEEDADGAEGEVVVDWIDEREDFEEGVVDSVDEGRVQVYEGDGGVFDGDFYGLDEGGYEHL